jgi:hypothetical protein
MGAALLVRVSLSLSLSLLVPHSRKLILNNVELCGGKEGWPRKSHHHSTGRVTQVFPRTGRYPDE